MDYYSEIEEWIIKWKEDELKTVWIKACDDMDEWTQKLYEDLKWY